MIFSLFSPDVAAAELLCRRRGNLWPCFSPLIHKQMEVFESDLPKLIQPQTERARSSRFYLRLSFFWPLVPSSSSRTTRWAAFPPSWTRHPARARSHISRAAPRSMSNMTTVKNRRLSGDKTSSGGGGDPSRCVLISMPGTTTTTAVW